LFRWQNDLSMSSTQDEMVRNARGSPAFVSIATMKAQQAAIAEYAFLFGAEAPSPARDSPPGAKTSRIVIPISDTRQVTGSA